MAFIVRKKIKGRDYYYLRESKRVDGKVKAITKAYLGKSLEEAEEKFKKIKSGHLEMEEEDIESGKTGEFVYTPTKISIDELANFCKSKGFVFRSSDIYGGFAGFWDYGHLGVELFNSI